ncbi:hypothetical protein [Spirosoma fluviale]|uniref:Uncharacterized protein n=1 Tax=Spirosoma fluviale TaxID=1597977 RepID=A0A286GK49_9BACT|nr:hypothetical protein [Spirosoma fluviale]SOD95364.1 hypothetical protein SAMN06269250_4834 [Spirosoma fluviale]
MEATPSIDVLLENYILHVADKYIVGLSPENQTRLIKLVNQIGKLPADAGATTDRPNEMADKRLVNNLFSGLEEQWMDALASPAALTKKPVLSELTVELLQRTLVLNQREIEATLLCIKRMAELIARAETTCHASGQQDKLIQHYRTVQDGYTARLEQLKSFEGRRTRSLCL